MMARVAATLGVRARRRKSPATAAQPIPHLWFLTDPVRTPDPCAAIAGLSPGAAVVFRAFGARDGATVARRLRRMTRQRGLKLLIGADWRLAAAIDADGVHLPQRLARLAPGLRRRRPGWLITAAAHDEPAIVAGAQLALDAILLSVVFPSRSPSAGRALGVIRFNRLAGRSRIPVVALGGVNDATAARLRGSRAAGLAGVGGFAIG
jgi:thiamine-phosphate pyrophosphorylase